MCSPYLNTSATKYSQRLAIAILVALHAVLAQKLASTGVPQLRRSAEANMAQVMPQHTSHLSGCLD